MNDKTTMTEQDLLEAPALADQIIALLAGVRGPKAVAGVALALAGATLLAECGPKAAIFLYLGSLRDLVVKESARVPVGSLDPQFAQANREANAIAALLKAWPL